MKLTGSVLLMVLALLCFVVQVILSLAGGSSGKLNLMALGAALFVVSFLV